MQRNIFQHLMFQRPLTPPILKTIHPQPILPRSQAQSIIRNVHPQRTTMELSTSHYQSWTHENLIARISLLEQQLKTQSQKYVLSIMPMTLPNQWMINPKTRYQRSVSSGPALPPREFKPSKYSTRFIALKFAYLGRGYNGLEHHAKNRTPLPTVEEVLWKALMKARLIFPTPVEGLGSGEEVNWEGCEYSKCGRTDKGVSAFGQVVGLRVRSNRPLSKERLSNGHEGTVTEQLVKDGVTLGDRDIATSMLGSNDDGLEDLSHSTEASNDETTRFDPINDEIPYPQVLNRLLPPDIRVLAWCPTPPKDFSARFSCKERQYKYFFTQPAFSPTIGPRSRVTTNSNTERSRREGWLDIEAMRAAAQDFVGLHDFRNFCKVDASKQIENFERRIFRATIDELDPRVTPMGYLKGPEFSEHGGEVATIDGVAEGSGPTIFAFTLHGSAFLWHQVRHMVGILFLIGQGLESPSLVRDLLDVKKLPGKPQYEMADDAPLVLWDCIFPGGESDSGEDALDWRYIGDCPGNESGTSRIPGGKGGKHGLDGAVDEVWKVWRQRKIDEVLAGSLLNIIAGQGVTTHDAAGQYIQRPHYRGSQKVFAGADSARLVGRYIPILQKPRMQSVEEINSRYVKRKAKDGIIEEAK